MAKFWELLERSIIVQSLVTLICVGAITYLYTTGKEVPSTLVDITLLILGYWFGSKVQSEAVRITNRNKGE
jgi:uncharacterized membrane protein AbrB (regulator of aidB expression)